MADLAKKVTDKLVNGSMHMPELAGVGNIKLPSDTLADAAPAVNKKPTGADKPAAGADKVNISPENQKYVDILSPEAKQHILYGDNPTSGGHLYPGQPGKTAFPENWSADKIVHEVGDITTSPNTQWYAQTGTGGIYTNKGKPSIWVAYEQRDNVRIRVVFQPATGKIITAFPDNNSIPSNYRKIPQR